MTREIKFRAWHKELGVMVDWRGMNKLNDLYDALDCNHYDVDTATFVVLQYVGLHDKNGREIYEGDIVKETGSYQSGTYHWEHIYVVEADAPNGGFNLRDVDGEYEDLFYQVLEVIGNIYENPELIKEVK